MRGADVSMGDSNIDGLRMSPSAAAPEDIRQALEVTDLAGVEPLPLTDDLLDDIDLGERVVGLFQVLPDATLSGPYLPMVVDRAEIVAAAS